MWKRCLAEGSKPWVTASTVFFGVMLMPVGIALHMALVRPSQNQNEIATS
jgi:hypothetical protein